MSQTKQNPQTGSKTDTIFAWATPPGRSGVAVLRFSGAGSLDILPKFNVSRTLTPRKAELISLRHPEHGLIDQCLAIYFPAPHSFTGEDCLELHTHGSRAVIALLSRLLHESADFRLAEPGEFSKRAFLNGKMDLLQAEGLADLIEADTLAQHRQANALLDGKISDIYNSLRERIIHIRAHVEAYIDFPDEDIPEDTLQNIYAEVRSLIEEIDRALATANSGERIREGFRIALIGAPNAGKSTLFNALAKRDLAIISDEAGTTRDALECHLDINGYPVVLIDTAGIRETDSLVESEGIRRAKAHAEAADLILQLVDATQSGPVSATNETPNKLIINTKADLLDAPSPSADALNLSLHNEADITQLLAVLGDEIEKRIGSNTHPIVTREHHKACLITCRSYLESFYSVNESELMAENLRLAGQEIEKITGRIPLDTILDVLFGAFCIGK